MFALSWQVTVVSLLLVPLFLLPARWMGRRLQALTREQMGLNADMSTQMTERFNVAGALLVKLFGRPDDEAAAFSVACRPGARHRRAHGHGQPLVLHRAGARRLARDGDRVRARRQPGHPGRPHHRHAAGAGRPARPAVRPAHGSVQRAGRRHDRTGQLRARVRGARPQAHGQRGPRRATAARRSAVGGVRRCRFRYPRAERGVAGVPGVRRARGDHGVEQRRADRDLLPRARRHDDRAGGSVGRGQDDDHGAADAALRRHRRGHPDRRRRRARRDAGLAARGRRRRHAGLAHVPRHDPREPAVRAAGGDRGAAARGLLGSADPRA